MKLSEKLKYLMLEKNITQVNLANDLDIERSTLTRILNNTTQVPKIDTIYSLAKYFNIDVKELLDFDDSQHELSILPNSSLKEVLAALMQKNSISVNSLHKYTNISRSVLTDILNGKTTNPNIYTLQKIANYFNITTTQLCGIKYISQVAQVQPQQFQIPLISIQLVHSWFNGYMKDVPGYIPSTIQTLGNRAYAIKVDNNNYFPDFLTNQVLVINDSHPTKGDFAIYHINMETSIYEIINLESSHIFLRKAGKYPQQKYNIAEINWLGTLTQQLTQ